MLNVNTSMLTKGINTFKIFVSSFSVCVLFLKTRPGVTGGGVHSFLFVCLFFAFSGS